MCRILCYDSKTILTSCAIRKLHPFEHRRHIHMHEFSNSVGLLSSLRDAVMHLRDEELWYEPRETTVRQNSSNPHEGVKIAWLHEQMSFYISFAFALLIGLGLV